MERSLFYRVDIQVLPTDTSAHVGCQFWPRMTRVPTCLIQISAITDDSTGITDKPMPADQADLLATSSKVSFL